VRKKVRVSIDEEDVDASDEYKCLTILKSMRCFHNQILFDDEYISKCYPITIASRNRGWLCLVAKPYFALGNALLHKIRCDKIMEKLSTGNRGAIKNLYDRLLEEMT